MCYQDRSFILILFLIGAPLFFSCEKEGELSEAVSEESSELSEKDGAESGSGSAEKLDAPGGGGMELCSCPGYTLTNDGGSWDCPPGDGCTKITPCPCPGGGGNPALTGEGGVDALLALDRAIEEGEVSEYFEDGPWREAFPFLAEKEEELDQLREGELTMLRLQPNERAVHYAAVAAPAEELSDAEEALFAIQVPNELFERGER